MYDGREQTAIKHEVLRNYLLRFALIVGNGWKAVTYVDGFSGPWQSKSDSLQDTSFAIAINEFRKARDKLGERGRSLGIRCYFVEKDPSAYTRLKQFADTITDATIETRNDEFESSIEDVLKFISQGGRDAFPFIFIDPTGWTGFSMNAIKPLLQVEPGEVLINFMTRHIRRFIDAPEEVRQEEFEALFGTSAHKEQLAGLEKEDRDDAAVRLYMRSLKAAGAFKHVCAAIILHPQEASTHFHLIYATRSKAGVEVFKDAERKAMDEMERLRAEAQQRRKHERTGQGALFGGNDLSTSTYYEYLRERYCTKAQAAVRRMLESRERVLYDDAWALALIAPLTWEQDLRNWLVQWEKAGLIRIENLKPRHSPKRDENVILIWQGPKPESQTG
jgi:three-Cys-motif partner protein